MSIIINGVEITGDEDPRDLAQALADAGVTIGGSIVQGNVVGHSGGTIHGDIVITQATRS